MFRTASFRLATLYVVLFTFSALVLGIAVYFTARSALRDQVTARIETETEFLHDEFRTGGVARVAVVVRARSRGAAALDYVVQAPDGTILAGDTPALAPFLVRDRVPGVQTWATIDVPEREEESGRPERVRALVSDLGDGILLLVGADLAQIRDIEDAIATAFAWTIGLAALLGIGGGAWISRAFLRRVDAITRTAEAIIGGDLARRIPISGTQDDLDRLAGTLNHMLDRIGGLMDSLRQVSSDVAHDLRTPLQRLTQRLEAARTRARSLADYEAAVDGAVLEAEGLLETFSALLRIAQVEGAARRAGFRDVDLTAVTEAVADAYRPDAEEAGHTLVASAGPGIVVRGDQELLTQALSNLVENALRHTPPGTRIAIELHRDSTGDVALSVGDDGPGVPPSDLPLLVHRFFRGDRSRTTSGNGLGLSLVAAVAELHGEQLILENTKPGLRATMRLPGIGNSQPSVHR